jgi:protein involved in polysaccharide export with SLBB domain
MYTTGMKSQFTLHFALMLASAWRLDRAIRRLRFGLAGALAALVCCSGCMKSLFNSWLEPSTVGDFTREGTTEIRSSLSIQDAPMGIPGATDPVPEDLQPVYEEYRVGPGDGLTVRILDLLARNVETPTNALVDELGSIRLPVIGRVHAGGLTVRELEEEIADYLEQQQIIKEAQVIVEPVVRRGATYGVFGTVASPNVYPLSTPNLTLLQALSFAGGLADVVTSVYVFREEGDQRYVAPTPIEFQPPPVETPGVGRQAAQVSWEGSSNRGVSEVESQAAFASALQTLPPAWSTPPEDQEEARREVIEAVVPAETPLSQPAEVEPPPAEEPTTSQPRWIFLNGKWIELEPEAGPDTVTQPERAITPERPLDFPAEPQPTIDWAEVAEESRRRIIRVSAEALRNGDPRQNIVVRAGDTIRLMAGEAGEYYMMGQINRPGSYSLAGRRLTLKTAVAAAGNLSALAWPSRCTVYRRLGDREEMIQVNVDRIFAGQDPDFYIKRDDLIVFGTHPASLFLAIMRSAFRLTYGFGFVYDRNFADVDTTRRNVTASINAQQEAAQGNRFQGLFP